MRYYHPFGGYIEIPEPAKPELFSHSTTTTKHGIVFHDEKERQAVCACGHILEWDPVVRQGMEYHHTVAAALGAHLRKLH